MIKFNTQDICTWKCFSWASSHRNKTLEKKYVSKHIEALINYYKQHIIATVEYIALGYDCSHCQLDEKNNCSQILFIFTKQMVLIKNVQC